MAEGGSTSLAKAYVQIIPTAQGITGQLSSIMSGEGEAAGKAGGGALASGLAKALGATAAIGTAVAGVTTAVGKAVAGAAQETAAYGDNVDKMSQKIGISAEAYQKWDYVMSLAGTSVDNLQASMKTLSKAAQDGSDAFTELGISQQAAASMSKEDLFSAVIAGLSGMEEGTKRTALATELLGRSATELGPLLNVGTEAIAEQMATAEAYGMIMSNEAVAASAAFQDSLTTMQNTFTGLKNSIVAQFLPSMTEAMDGLAMLLTGNEEGLVLIKEGLSGFVNQLSAMIPTVIEIGGELVLSLVTTLVEGLITHIPDLVQTGIDLLVSLVTALPEIIGTITAALPEIVTGIVSTLLDNIPILVDAGVTLLVALVENLPAIIAGIIKAIPQIITSLVKAVIEGVPRMVEAGVQLLLGLAEGIAKAVWSVIQSVIDAVSGIVNSVLEFLGIHSPSRVFAEIGGYTMAGLAEGIMDNTGLVSGALEDVSDMMTGQMESTLSVNASVSGSGTQRSAELDLLRDISAKLDRLYVYLDGTKMVGYLASDIDRALGSRSVLAGRGVI